MLHSFLIALINYSDPHRHELISLHAKKKTIMIQASLNGESIVLHPYALINRSTQSLTLTLALLIPNNQGYTVRGMSK